MNNNWVTTSNGGNNFVDLFKARFASETRVNQWYYELTTLRQKNDESVDAYTNTFIKLATRVNLTDTRQKKRMYLMGRSEEHTSELQSPCNLVCRLLLEKKKHTPHYRSLSLPDVFLPKRLSRVPPPCSLPRDMVPFRIPTVSSVRSAVLVTALATRFVRA